MSDRITRGRKAIFGHVARLPDNIPAHQAMLRQVELSVGRPPDLHGRPPGRPRTKWTDQLRRDNNNVKLSTRSTGLPSTTTFRRSGPESEPTDCSLVLRLCEGKLLVAVTRERRYSPSGLCVNYDDDDCQSTKVKVTLWSVDLTKGSDC